MKGAANPRGPVMTPLAWAMLVLFCAAMTGLFMLNGYTS